MIHSTLNLVLLSALISESVAKPLEARLHGRSTPLTVASQAASTGAGADSTSLSTAVSTPCSSAGGADVTSVAPDPAATSGGQVTGSDTDSDDGDEVGDQSSQGWVFYGCYFDCYDGMNRHLPVSAYNSTENSPDMCVQACMDKGYVFAGLQFGKECYCGNSLGGQLAGPQECNVPCEDEDEDHGCGGPCRNDIWSACALGAGDCGHS